VLGFQAKAIKAMHLHLQSQVQRQPFQLHSFKLPLDSFVDLSRDF
jgi:hypothetical protein